MCTPHGCSAEHPNVSRRSAHPPRFGVSEATMQNPGRKNAPRERDGLFDIMRRSASAVAAHFGETNPTNPTRVVPAHSASKTRVNALMLGTHNHGLWLWVPALRPLRGRRPGRRSFIRTKNQPAAARKHRRPRSVVSGLLFTMTSATPTCRAVSARSGRRPARARRDGRAHTAPRSRSTSSAMR
jgi:hypothetical protein